MRRERRSEEIVVLCEEEISTVFLITVSLVTGDSVFVIGLLSLKDCPVCVFEWMFVCSVVPASLS